MRRSSVLIVAVVVAQVTLVTLGSVSPATGAGAIAGVLIYEFVSARGLRRVSWTMARPLVAGALALAVMAAALAVPDSQQKILAADNPQVILLHGWNGSVSNWSTAKAQYESQGYTVHSLTLPRSGSSAGDTVVNADYVQGYIASNNLTDVKLDGHSLGGWLALYLTLVRGEDVSSVVLRDTGTGCWFGIPGDQCSGSTLLAQVNGAAPSSVPILNLSSKTTALPQVDCLKVYSGLAHNDFLSNSAVTAAAIGWPTVSPCAASTPTSTPSPTPTPTATPTPTPTPCSWWDRLWGRC